ncbi:Isochorismatase-like protein [Mycena maculata]|uniref:Isochorismatase-like protein n=1 Tax=Mycena maculata TaxID=230809 RepID=A0AAD7MHK1_9AGAR|nr:Isochorismatase-like protein [Mycena maculata]
MELFPELGSVLGNISSIIQAFRVASLPMIHIHHASLQDHPLNPTLYPEGYAVFPEAAPVGDEVVFVKHVNSGFIGTGLEAHLRAAEIDTLVILGLATSHCVSTTTRMAGNLGWKAYLPRDATAMFEGPAASWNQKPFDAETMHEVALAELHEEFADVVATEEIIESLKAFAKV